MLKLFAELYLLLVWSFDGEELHAVLPEGQSVHLGVEHFQSGTLHNLKKLVDVLHVDGDVVDGADAMAA